MSCIPRVAILIAMLSMLGGCRSVLSNDVIDRGVDVWKSMLDGYDPWEGDPLDLDRLSRRRSDEAMGTPYFSVHAGSLFASVGDARQSIDYNYSVAYPDFIDYTSTEYELIMQIREVLPHTGSGYALVRIPREGEPTIVVRATQLYRVEKHLRSPALKMQVENMR